MREPIMINSDGIGDAPADGNTYARKDGAWVQIHSAVQSSDVSVKSDIIEIDKKKILKAINSLGLYSYMKEGKYEIGVLAQEVEKIFPSVVVEEDGIKKVDYARLGVIIALAKGDA